MPACPLKRVLVSMACSMALIKMVMAGNGQNPRRSGGYPFKMAQISAAPPIVAAPGDIAEAPIADPLTSA